jgi:prevent-host-death family protein
MKQIPATQFKQQCLALLDSVDAEGIIITKHGKPVAKLVSVEKKNFSDYYGALKGRLKVKGNIFSTGIKWDAES